jgi:hypothetical protein
MTIKKLFNDDNTYTQDGLDLASAIYPLVLAQINDFLGKGYNLRTVLGPASVPSASASAYGVCPREFQAVWISEVFDITLGRILFNETNR